MSGHDNPPGRDLVGFLLMFAIAGMVGDLLIRDWPLVSAFLKAHPEVLAAIAIVCLLAVAALILGTALRRSEP